jgi:hypothetical protein
LVVNNGHLLSNALSGTWGSHNSKIHNSKFEVSANFQAKKDLPHDVSGLLLRLHSSLRAEQRDSSQRASVADPSASSLSARRIVS